MWPTMKKLYRSVLQKSAFLDFNRYTRFSKKIQKIPKHSSENFLPGAKKRFPLADLIFKILFFEVYKSLWGSKKSDHIFIQKKLQNF